MSQEFVLKVINGQLYQADFINRVWVAIPIGHKYFANCGTYTVQNCPEAGLALVGNPARPGGHRHTQHLQLLEGAYYTIGERPFMQRFRSMHEPDDITALLVRHNMAGKLVRMRLDEPLDLSLHEVQQPDNANIRRPGYILHTNGTDNGRHVQNATYAVVVRPGYKGSGLRLYWLFVWPETRFEEIELFFTGDYFRVTTPLWEHDRFPLESRESARSPLTASPLVQQAAFA